MYFDAAYQERTTLRDGREVVLRVVRPDDKDRLRRGFGALSPESRYRRFFSVKSDLSDDELRYLTEVDGDHHFALGAVTPDGEHGLGIARFIRIDGEPGVAEAAIAVLDSAQGLGLGALLFQRLVAAAAERGVARFRCEMLGTNAGMGELVRGLAPAVSTEVASGVVRMEFALPTIGPAHPASEPPRETGLYRLFALVAEGVLEWRARWQRLGERLWRGDGEHPPRASIGATAAGADDEALDEE
ncbi:MAG: GNAT family N-acetyltransferase [Myxococcales bacterium]|nr:GNAT family N-acetyltransferase [Myxococcales bacterium]